MGIPKYPKDLGTEWMNLERKVQNLHTSANSRVAFRKLSDHVRFSPEGMHVIDGDGNTVLFFGALPDGSYGVGATRGGSSLVNINNAMIGVAADQIVSAAESTSSNSFTDLATEGPQVEVEVGSTGKMKVTVGAKIFFDVPSGLNVSNNGGRMGFEIVGPGGTQVALDRYSVGHSAGYDLTSGTSNFELYGELQASRTMMITGLTPGTHTITAKYKSINTTVSFADRMLLVEPY